MGFNSGFKGLRRTCCLHLRSDYSEGRRFQRSFGKFWLRYEGQSRWNFLICGKVKCWTSVVYFKDGVVRVHNMNAYRKTEILLHSFLTSVINGIWWSVWRPGHFTLGIETSDTRKMFWEKQWCMKWRCYLQNTLSICIEFAMLQQEQVYATQALCNDTALPTVTTAWCV